MVKSDSKLYRFGNFQLDPIKRVLLCDGAPVQLPPKALDVLLVLVEHNQYVIEKDELMRLVWGERIVEENNLTRHISTLRKVLDESPNDHNYIVTVPGRGYSFVAPVEAMPANGTESSTVKLNGNDAAPPTTDSLVKPNRFDRATQLDLCAQTVATPPSQAFGIETATRKKKLWLRAVLVVILVIAGLLGFKFFYAHSKLAALNSYRDWETVRMTRTGGSVNPAISRDGKYVAYVTMEVGRTSVWILQIATLARQQIVPPEQFSYLDLLFTPDGSELYFSRRERATPEFTLYRIPALGGIARKLRDDLASRFTLSPDGAHLAFTHRTGENKSEFVITNADGVEERVLANHSLERPAWSPDGNSITYTEGTADSGGEEMSIHEILLRDGSTQEFSPKRWTYIAYLSWLSDASGLIITARDQQSVVNRLWFVAYPGGEARPISNDADHFKNIGLTENARGLVAEQIVAVSDIWRGPLADVAEAKKVGVWGRDGLCLLPDGRIIYSSIQTGSAEASKIWIMNSEGMEPKQLTEGRNNDICPVASPDGRYIVFASDRTGNFEIWRMNLDGSNLVQLTSSNGANPPSISPDGRWVIYLSTNDNWLYRVPLEGGNPRRVACNAVGYSAISPDGKRIAYFAQGKNAWNISVSSFEDGKLLKQFEIGSHALNNTSLKWVPDGKSLLYSCSTNGVSNIWMQPLNGSAPKQVTDFKADGIFRFDVSKDGKELICARGGWKHDIVLMKNLR